MQKHGYIKAQLFSGQVIAVFIWFLITVVEWSNNPNNNPGLKIPVIIRGVEALSVLMVSGVLIFLVEKVKHHFEKFLARILLLVVIYFFAVAANVLSLLIREIIGYTPPKLDSFFFIQSLHFYIPLFLAFVVYSMIKNRIGLLTETENKLKAEGLAQQAKWMMLRYQVNPHFLFNALNSIRALIGHDNEKARNIVTKMSEYFRYSLSIEKKTTVALKEEIEAVENYLEIQKVRYPERLKISKVINPNVLDCIIPVFSIQTLIENAIKYGLKTHEGVIAIDINVKSENEKLKIQISNTGKLVVPKEKHSEGTNTGLENLKSRLRFLDEDFEFDLFQRENKVIASLLLTRCSKYEDVENNNC